MADQKRNTEITDYTKSAYIGSDIPNDRSEYREETGTEITPSFSAQKPSLNEETACLPAVSNISVPQKSGQNFKSMEASREISAPVSLKKQPMKQAGNQNIEASNEFAAPVSLSKQISGSQENREETAAEIAAPVSIAPRQNAQGAGAGGMAAGVGIGYVALALSILSLFVLPVLFGAAGIVLGFVGLRRGAGGIGAWAIGIGIVSIIIGIFILPFV